VDARVRERDAERVDGLRVVVERDAGRRLVATG
jgi:hypothetical protein